MLALGGFCKPLYADGVRTVVLRLLALALTLASCGTREPETKGFNAPATTKIESGGDGLANGATSSDPNAKPDQVGLATWYGKAFAGKKTTSGERFDPDAMTAAHRKLPFGTWVEVRRVDTGTSVRVRINDRGPWGDDKKVIDLSRAAAERIGLVREGIVKVELRVVHGAQ
ncbi:MAG: Rare lipoprotein precursor [Myxococcaceae bacterium]|nr:Rare lipoprotein precursor [Myxococcaceae bacterium]